MVRHWACHDGCHDEYCHEHDGMCDGMLGSILDIIHIALGDDIHGTLVALMLGEVTIRILEAT
jgi:hypothetical protein